MLALCGEFSLTHGAVAARESGSSSHLRCRSANQATTNLPVHPQRCPTLRSSPGDPGQSYPLSERDDLISTPPRSSPQAGEDDSS
jgi:hypothetical protein